MSIDRDPRQAIASYLICSLNKEVGMHRLERL